MDRTNRRVGRPKMPPRTGPLVLENDRSRETVSLQVSSETARELAEYAAWVEGASSMTTADATFTTVEYALRQVFHRDRIWQERRRSRERQKPAAASVKQEPAPVGPPPRPVALPPPVSTGAPRVPPDRSL
jgi:hypothetical protein